MFKWRGKRVVVMGLGLHGGAVAVAGYFAKNKANVLVTDTKNAAELRPSIKKLKKFSNIHFRLGAQSVNDFAGADLIIPNPAVPRESRLLRHAKKANIPILNEAALFFLFCRRPIIGVTGTRGKSTTTSLIHHLLKIKCPNVLLAGNIRDTVMFDIINKVNKKNSEPVILELSSWHLEGLEAVKKGPKTAVITNLYPDHLNRYRTLASYYRSKYHIFKYQSREDQTIFNYDIPAVRQAARFCKSRRYWFSGSTCRLKGDGTFIKNEQVVFQKDGHITVLISLHDIGLKGRHNLSNVMAALTVAHLWGVKIKNKSSVLSRFRPLSGRQELVAVKRGISFYNDTNATTPEATMAFLKTIDKPVILIIGGDDKKLNYGVLARNVIKKAKSVILLPGSATNKLKKEFRFLKPRKSQIIDAKDLSNAFQTAVEQAQTGEAIALSPAATSFSQFNNEFERGEQFVGLVKKF